MSFDKDVTKIKWSGEQSITVECLDGSVYDADHVILTVSLGVLKEKHSTLFEPALPSEKINAIQGLAFGSVDKIYVQFEEKFWPTEWPGFSVLWNNKELDEVRQSEYAWLEDVFGFFVFDSEQNVLCGWISGANARRMETFGDEEIQRRVMQLMRRHLPKMTIPDPISIRV